MRRRVLRPLGLHGESVHGNLHVGGISDTSASADRLLQRIPHDGVPNPPFGGENLHVPHAEVFATHGTSEREQEMTAAQFEQLEETEAVEVLRWRFDVLIRVGFGIEDAAVLAANVEIDLHAAENLMRRGCPSETALRILI